MPVPITPCPSCAAALRVKGERGTCPKCGQAVRFVDAPEVDCVACGRAVPILPGRHAAKCPHCGAWSADEPGQDVVGQAQCPRCRRRVTVPLDEAEATCPHCRSRMALQGTL